MLAERETQLPVGHVFDAVAGTLPGCTSGPEATPRGSRCLEVADRTGGPDRARLVPVPSLPPGADVLRPSVLTCGEVRETA